MHKIPKKFLITDPFRITESPYLAVNHQRAESIFSLSNEYQGLRGFFEEGTNEPHLLGTYFNGIYEWGRNPVKSGYQGIIKRTHHLVNSLNYLVTKISVGSEVLNLSTIKFADFQRSLDLKTGLLVRSFTWHLVQGGCLQLSFQRILSQVRPEHVFWQLHLTSLDYTGPLSFETGLSFATFDRGEPSRWTVSEFSNPSLSGLIGRTESTNQLVGCVSFFQTNVATEVETKTDLSAKTSQQFVLLNLVPGQEIILKKHLINVINKEGNQTELEEHAIKDLQIPYNDEQCLIDNTTFYQVLYDQSDIEIVGDPCNQQGIRYCIFSLSNTYHGLSPFNNIGAKGLTGEAYSGHAFWDTETYCAPYYLFNDLKSAKNLLLYRYNTLPQARLRAQEVDCQGACYPIATLNGYESCDLWQHALTQIQPTTGVAYAIYHYLNVSKDWEFLPLYGFEMLHEIAKFLASRGDFNQQKTKFGYYAVMGPDEFQLMVNHDYYTNYLAKKALTIFLDYLYKYYVDDPKAYQKLCLRLGITKKEIAFYRTIIRKMVLRVNRKTGLIEQHQGFYDLPHIDLNSIPDTDFPLYSHWSYDRIYRNDLIKQPSVLMAMLLFNGDYTVDQIKVNYDYYEPKTIHESSLSPSVHSILACQLGYEEQALDFFSFATRLDLDDYNNNTDEGLHLTSIVAAWLNIVYGFGGLRSDEAVLKLAPIKPAKWDSYAFHLLYRGVNLKIEVRENLVITASEDLIYPVKIYQNLVYLKKGINEIARPN